MDLTQKLRGRGFYGPGLDDLVRTEDAERIDDVHSRGPGDSDHRGLRNVSTPELIVQSAPIYTGQRTERSRGWAEGSPFQPLPKFGG
ncbi:hypothetical protein GCM10023346_49050 [Arthrobacter gyeryongensis]|uniref:Uncharacterized protein n=1 Tax=Arthrobacter gyeryongensis TaxID=1650592 RepID=A0ABP8V9G6_9MICC